jgi:hypothetical protein
MPTQITQINAAAAPVGFECLFSGDLIPVTIIEVTTAHVLAEDEFGVKYWVDAPDAWAWFWKESE